MRTFYKYPKCNYYEVTSICWGNLQKFLFAIVKILDYPVFGKLKRRIWPYQRSMM